MIKTLSYVVCILLITCTCYGKYVTTPLGDIKGSIQTSHGGRKYSAFEGIPYAKPPIGDRRFEEPEPVEAWSGVWEANFLTTCAQTSMIVLPTSIEMDEDCLHINVYVPRENPKPEEQLDVIVHIHGGAYMYASGHAYTHAQFLMDHDIIFVTFNYRLGILGFLSTEDDVVPGNNGLKDQVLALKWVQQNIASFGGNPDSVTITGLSAGGSSVHLHYFSDMSKGLFHKGFSQSGLALNPWTLQEEPLNKAKILADAVGCPTNPSGALVQCLKQRPYHHLLAKMPLFFSFKFLPAAPFAPVVERGSNPFLKADPYHLLIRGEVQDVPWIASNTAHEGLFPVAYFKDELTQVNDEWEDLAPFLLDYNYTLPRSQWESVAKTIREKYLGQEPINQENLLKLVEIFSDRFFLTDAETAVREQAKVTKSDVYYYYFNYPGDDDSKTVAHGADHKYFFGERFLRKPLTSNELKMKDVILEMLVSFAKTGKPTIKGVKWDPTQHEKLTYLHVDGFKPENIQLKSVKELTSRDFWNSLGFQESENLILAKDEL